MTTPADLSGMTVQVHHRFDAAPEQVWALLSDLPRMARLSDEVTELSWQQVDLVFRAVNRLDGREWTVTGHVVEREAPRLLRWTVLDPACPSSTWSYELAPDGAGTLVTHAFAHGPGPSGVRYAVEADPSRRDEVVRGRSAALAAGMAASLQEAARLLGG